MPGGHFEGVDLEDETRTAQAGPWQRCFTCGSAGPWRKCGGAVRFRVVFVKVHDVRIYGFVFRYLSWSSLFLRSGMLERWLEGP